MLKRFFVRAVMSVERICLGIRGRVDQDVLMVFGAVIISDYSALIMGMSVLTASQGHSELSGRFSHELCDLRSG